MARSSDARRPWTLVLVALCATCSPATVSDQGDAVRSACADFAYAYCGQTKFCSLTGLQLRYGDEPTCEAIERAKCESANLAPSTGNTPSGQEACAKAIAGWACSDFLVGANRPPACLDLVGQLPNGAPCTVQGQCQTGFCALTNARACGTCAPVPQPGDPCTTGGEGPFAQCPPGLSCQGGKCAEFVGSGVQCGAQPCGPALVCVGSPGVCEAPVGMLGAKCTFAGPGCDLSQGLTCNAQNGTCVTAHLGAAGEACGQVGTQVASCIAGTCDHSGTCVSYLPVGAPCNVGGVPCLPVGGEGRCVVARDGDTAGVCEIIGTGSCP